MTSPSRSRHRSDTALLGRAAGAPARARLKRTRVVVAAAAKIAGPLYMVAQIYVTGPRPAGRSPRRPRAEAEARALAGYLAHVAGGCSKRMIAKVMGMDCAQLTRAINMIEDRRDDTAFDAVMDRRADQLQQMIGDE